MFPDVTGELLLGQIWHFSEGNVTMETKKTCWFLVITVETPKQKLRNSPDYVAMATQGDIELWSGKEPDESVGVGDGLVVGVGLDVRDIPSLRDEGFCGWVPLFNMAGSNSGWRRACLLRWSLRIKRLSQIGQQNLFSPKTAISIFVLFCFVTVICFVIVIFFQSFMMNYKIHPLLKLTFYVSLPTEDTTW